MTAGSGSGPGWMEAQDDLATLSTNSVHRVVDGATHTDLVLRKDAAAATSETIRDVVASVRGAGPLGR